MKKQLEYFLILITFFLLQGNLHASTFDINTTTTPTVYSSNSLIDMVDGVTLTMSTDSGKMLNTNYLVSTDTSYKDITFIDFNFSAVINIESLKYVQPFTSGFSQGDNVVFTPTDGSGNSVVKNPSSSSWTQQIVTPNWQGITSFRLTVENGDIYRVYFDEIVFTLSNTKTYVDSVVLASAESNTKKSAQTLQNIKDNGGYTGMSSVFTALDALSTDTQVAQAIDETTPQTATTSLSASNNIAQGISGIVSQRQNVNLSAGLNSGDEIFSDKNIWFKPYGSIGSQNDKDGINGFDINTYGLAFGVDGEYEDNQTFGLGFFYTNAKVDVNNVQQSSNLDVYSLVAYGSNPIIDDKTKFMYQVGYSLQKNESSRFVSLTSDTASAKYTSKTASLDLKVLRDYKVNDDLLLQPMISTTYRHFTNPSYSESGAGSLNLDVEKFTTTEFLLGLGTMAHYKLNDNSKLVGNINVDYDLHDRTTTVTSSYQGASGVTFDTDGIDNGRVSYDVGVGYENQINDLSNVTISYNYQGKGSDYSNNVISAKYTYKF